MEKTIILDKIKNHLNINTNKVFAEFLGIKPTTLSMWHKRNTFDIELIFKKCEFINANWLLTGKEPMLKNIDKTNIVNEPSEIYQVLKKTNSIPLIPTEAFAGLGGGEVSIKESDIQDHYVVPEFTNVDFMIRIKGSSMYPKYNSGDVVACKMITDSNFIQWNKVHVISSTIQGTLIKRLKKSTKENHLLAVSDNPSYDPFDIPEDEIINIALVTGVIRLE